MSAERFEPSQDLDTAEAATQLGDANLTDDMVKQYLKEIGRTPLLTAEEEVEVSMRIEAGLYAEQLLSRGDESLGTAEELEWLVADGQAATRQMLEANTRLVVSIAKKYHGRGLPMLDNVQNGNVGLMRAVEKFDYQKGYKFSTYATWWIRQAITRGLHDTAKLVRLPVHVGEVANRVATTRRQLQADLGREPDIDEIAAECDVTTEVVTESLAWNRDHLSLDMPLGEEDSTTVGDILADQAIPSPEEQIVNRSAPDELRSLLGVLSERSADIIASRYGLHNGGTPESLQSIAKRWGIGAERVRQIEREAINTLRSMTDGRDAFDEHRVNAQKRVAARNSSKGSTSLGSKARERLAVAEGISRHRDAVGKTHIEVLDAFVQAPSHAAAAEMLGIPSSQYQTRLRLARHALDSAMRRS